MKTETIEEKVNELVDCEDIKKVLITDLQENYGVELGFTTFYDVYKTHPSLRHRVQSEDYNNEMATKYLMVYLGVVEILGKKKE